MSEKRMDALFRKIVQNDAEEESRKLVEQRQDSPDDAASELSRARFEAMLDRELPSDSTKKDKTHRFRLSKKAKRVITAVAACFIVMFGLMMSSGAVRSRITQFFVSLPNGQAEITMDNNLEPPPSEWVIYRLSYVPEGYRLVKEEHEDGQWMTYRKSETERFDFAVSTGMGITIREKEDAHKADEIVDIHGESGSLFVYSDFSAIMWSPGSGWNTCLISGTLSEEEILKIANGVTVTESYPTVDPETP